MILNQTLNLYVKLPKYCLILVFFFCGTPEEKNTQPKSVEPVKIRGRIQIDEIKYSGPPAQSWIVAGIRDTVTNDLAKVREVEAISIDDQNKALKMIAERRKAGEKNLDPSKESAKILAADYLCVGNLQNTGKVLRLNIRLLKAPDFSAEQTATLDGTLDEIFTLQDKVVESLLANVDVKMTPEERLVIEVFTPKNKKAYELYSQGLQIEDTNPKKALDLFLQALRLEPDYLGAINSIGTQYFYLSQYDESLNYHNIRKRILEDKKLDKQQGYAITLNNIGAVYSSQGKHAEALKLYLSSLKLIEELGLSKTLGYASSLHNIGEVFSKEESYQNATDYFNAAQKLKEELGLSNTRSYAYTLISIGLLYSRQNNYETALKYYSDANRIMETLNLKKTAGYATLINNIGLVHDENYEYEPALEYYFKAQKIREELGLVKTVNYATTLDNIGTIYYSQKKYCQSVEWIEKAIKIKEQNGVPSKKQKLESAKQECKEQKK